MEENTKPLKTLVFFSPQGGIWRHSYPEALLAESLFHSGYRVIWVTCHGTLLPHCTVLESDNIYHTSEDKIRNQACHRCQNTQNLIQKNFKFEYIDLNQLLTSEDHKLADTFVSKADWSAPENIKFEETNAGLIAPYEYLLRKKKNELKFHKEEFIELNHYLKNYVLSYLASKKIMTKYQPDAAVTYNSLYGPNRAFLEVCKKNNVHLNTLHSGINFSRSYQTLMMPRDFTYNHIREAKKHWPSVRSLKLNSEALAKLQKHFEVLFSGKSVFAYSSKASGQSLRERWKIPSDKKLIVAALSSYDERFAAETVGLFDKPTKSVFEKQVDWAKSLIKWVREKNNYHLVIRVHPREFPNKRESVHSPHAKELEATLRSLPDNVTVNWPSDKISIWDLMLETDVFLNAWSSVGTEMTLFGLPVVIYSDLLPHYPSELNHFGDTENLYFQKIEEALKKPIEIERSIKTARWLYWLYEALCVDISDASNLKFREQRTFLEKVLEKLEFETQLPIKKQLDLFNRPPLLKEHDLIKAWIESSVLPLELIKQKRYVQTSDFDESEELKKMLYGLLLKMGLDKNQIQKHPKFNAFLS